MFNHTFRLHDLPTAHHRAGLASLFLFSRWLRDHEGTLEVSLVDNGARVCFDEQGLRSLLAEVYKGVTIEIPSKSCHEGRAVLRTEDRNGKTFFIYTNIVPAGAFLRDIDPTPEKAYLKLWRDMMYAAVRTVRAARLPYERSVHGEEPLDAQKIYGILLKKPNDPVALSGSWMLGAREKTGDGLVVREPAITQFLLHFWPFVTHVMVPRNYLPSKGSVHSGGFLIGVPDVANIERFCRLFQARLKSRPLGLWGPYPEAAYSDVQEEVLGFWLDGEGADIFGVDAFHCEKAGNSMQIQNISRLSLPPPRSPISRISMLKAKFWHTWFRKRLITNLLKSVPWWFGFEEILRESWYKTLLDDSQWRHDTRVAFKESEEFSLARMVSQAVRGAIRFRTARTVGNRSPTKTTDIWRRLCRAFYQEAMHARPQALLATITPFAPKQGEEMFVPTRASEIRTLIMLAICAYFVDGSMNENAKGGTEDAHHEDGSE